jgi:hypothetical protein
MKNRTWALAVAVALGGLAGHALGQTTPGKPAAPAKPTGVAAVVNGEQITLADIDSVLNRDGPKAVQVPETKLREMRHGALAMMIDTLLWQQYIRKNCPPANPQDVAAELGRMAEGLKKSSKTVEDFCKDNGTTLAELKEDIGDTLRWRALVLSRTTEAELQKYFTANKDFFDQIAVRASHIVLRVPANAPDSEKQTAVAKLKALRGEIVGGKIDFAEAAKKHSMCPSKDQGGDLNFFPRKFMMDEEFARAAFAMKVGDVSDVVQTEFGYHLIKVTDRQAGTPADFVKMKESVREVYAIEMRNSVVLQQRKVSKVEVNLP